MEGSSPRTAIDLAGGNIGLFVDFGSSGLYRYDGSWALISTGNAEKMEIYGGKLAADFGASGLYEYDGGGWTRISTGDAEDMEDMEGLLSGSEDGESAIGTGKDSEDDVVKRV